LAVRCWRSSGRALVHGPARLALALFVATRAARCAYDASLRDLRDNWAPVTGLAVFAVVITTAAVAVVAIP